MDIKSLFCKNDLKQSFIASKLKVTQQTVSYWCTGRFQPSIEQLPKLAKVLNCTIEDVVLAIIKTKEKKDATCS